MKKQLELKQLVAYLPYNVKIAYESFVRLDVLETGNIDFYSKCKNNKLVLRPISDLTKEIEINGKKIVPLFEIAKLEFKIDFVNKYDLQEQFLAGHLHKIYFENGYNYYCVAYNERTGVFIFEDITNNISTVCPHNKQMNEKLKEYHFDTDGLIDAGLAIDINTI